MSNTVGLIGVGLLGSAMVERLLGGGHDVIGYDIDCDARDRLSALGGHVVESAEQVAEAAQRILISLPDSDIVRQLVDELRPHLHAGHDLLDTTTGSPEATVAISDALSAAGVRWLDTTVVGSSQQMRDGEAIILVGGLEEAFHQHERLLSRLGQKSFYVGSSGSAARMKLVVNLVIGLHRAVLAEGLTFAEALGFDRAMTLEILMASAAYSRMMETKGPKMVAEEFSAQARLAQHFKDVALILASGDAHQASLPLTRVHRDLLQSVVDAGDGQLDNSAIIKAFTRPSEDEV